MTEFDDDLSAALAATRRAREDVISLVNALTESDLSLGRRGGWTISQVLVHLVQSEFFYAAGVEQLRGSERSVAIESPPVRTAEEAVAALDRARAALEKAVDGVDEETFYRLGKLGGQEYSVLSTLENVELHDREHEAQIRLLLRLR